MASSGTPTISSLAVPATQYTSGQNLLVPLYGDAGMTVRSHYVGARSELVVPFVAPMYADASAQMGVLQREDVSITNIDNVFDVSSTRVEAAKILNSFTVNDVDHLGMLGLSAEVEILFRDLSFSEVLAALIATTANKDASATNMTEYLRKETHADLLSALAHNALANMLEASDLNVEIALDASNGALNMAKELDGSGSVTGTRAAQYRKALFTQIPEYTVEQYLRVSDGSNNMGFEDVSSIRFLPLLTGDVLTFVFDVTVGEYANNNIAPPNGANVQRVFRDNSTAYTTGTGNAAWNSTNDVSFNANVSGGYVDQPAVTPYNAPRGLTFLAPTKRRVALRVHLGTADSAEGKKFALVDDQIYNGRLSGALGDDHGNVVRTA